MAFDVQQDQTLPIVEEKDPYLILKKTSFTCALRLDYPHK